MKLTMTDPIRYFSLPLYFGQTMWRYPYHFFEVFVETETNVKISKYKNSFPNEILKYIFVYALKEPDNAIEIARKKGVFRYNAWGLDKNNALYILNQLKNKRELLNFSSDRLRKFYVTNSIVI